MPIPVHLTHCSVVKAVPKTYRNLSRAIEVRPAEGVALIEQKVRVTKIQRGQHHRPLLAKRLAGLRVYGGMCWFVVGTIALKKARTVRNRAR